MSEVKELNTQTGEVTFREFTEQEIQAQELAAAKEAQRLKKAEEIRLQREAVLAKLGLTAEEIEVLLS